VFSLQNSIPQKNIKTSGAWFSTCFRQNLAQTGLHSTDIDGKCAADMKHACESFGSRWKAGGRGPLFFPYNDVKY
jgi:hypothetical protein